MRLVFTTSDIAKGETLSRFLIKEGINNYIEVAVGTDWGSDNYGAALGKIWIYDEDTLDAALEWVKKFEESPDSAPFVLAKQVDMLKNVQDKVEVLKKQLETVALRQPKQNLQDIFPRTDPLDKITLFFLFLCCFLFIGGEWTAPKLSDTQGALQSTPMMMSPINKELMFDYPQSFVQLDKVIKLYGVDAFLSPQELPPGGQLLLGEAKKIPYWHGAYPMLLDKIEGAPIAAERPPMFEKIREGEVWRLFTPALLHHDILHILFNMIWLIVLGKQLGQRLPASKYILFVIIVAVFSNVCEYLVDGVAFLGFSGVICGMLAFIWVRQRVAPWEGYPLSRSTILFMVYYVLAILGLQLVSFYMQVFHQTMLPLVIANTAHLTGALMGALLGYTSFFNWHDPYSDKRLK